MIRREEVGFPMNLENCTESSILKMVGLVHVLPKNLCLGNPLPQSYSTFSAEFYVNGLFYAVKVVSLLFGLLSDSPPQAQQTVYNI